MYEDAVRLMESPDLAAFNIHREDKATRETVRRRAIWPRLSTRPPFDRKQRSHGGSELHGLGHARRQFHRDASAV